MGVAEHRLVHPLNAVPATEQRDAGGDPEAQPLQRRELRLRAPEEGGEASE
jgi:hypothetical protein